VNLDVVVVSFNSAEHLPGALAGLPRHSRVVVVDNASTDDSLAVAASLGAEVIANPVNAGFGAAVNIGVARGNREMVLLLNPDARVDATTVDALCERLQSDPALAVVSPTLVRPDGQAQRVRWPFPSAGRAWREALGLHRLLGDDDSRGFVIGACFLIRRAAFEAVGGFDARIWLYGEESELCRRLVDSEWKVALVDELVAEHVGGASAAGVEDLVFEHFERGGEHNVATADGVAALVSYRLANLLGALLRSVLPGRGSLHRRRVHRLVRVLVRHPMTVALDSPATSAPGEGLIVCSLEAWDDVWRRNQFLVRELLVRDPNRRVLFVEPPFDVVHELRRGVGRRRQRGMRPLHGEGRVVRFEPRKMAPRMFGPFADWSLRRQVRRAAADLGMCQPSLWVNDSTYAGMATETGWPAVYDITDDWTMSGDGARATRRIAQRESRLFAEALGVVVCSEDLGSTRRKARPDLRVIPNAVDAEHFQRRRARPADLPAGPVAVYVGTLHEDRIDVPLIVDLARARADLSVVLVGPSSLGAESERALSELPNVHLLGSRPYDDVPAYLQNADVVIVPHVVTAFTESLDPIKAYECLAVGRPTVATPVAGFRELGEPVICAERRQFPSVVVDVLHAGAIRSEPRSVPSWADRAGLFDEVLSMATPAGS